MTSAGQNVDDFNINHSSVYRQREKQRNERAKSVKQNFHPDPNLTLHWDGKIVPDITGNGKVERIAVIVTGATTCQLLGMVKVPEGTGMAAAKAIYTLIEEWGVAALISAFSFDTTAINTGTRFLSIYLII